MLKNEINLNKELKNIILNNSKPKLNKQQTKINVLVRDFTGKTHYFYLPINTTASELREKLKQKTGFKGDDYFVANGHIMDDSTRLDYYNVQDNQTIYQFLRFKKWNLKL